MNASEIMSVLQLSSNYNEVYVPEFTYGDLRIDVILVDLRHQWIRGFEIKTSRSDFLKDNKFALYTQICSSVSIVCPAELIQANEIEKPFGLLWVQEKDTSRYQRLQWKKRPKNFQRRNSMAWIWTYIHVLETELPRINSELTSLQQDNKSLKTSLRDAWEKYPDLLKCDLGKM